MTWGIAFARTRMVLQSRLQELTELGKGNKQHARRAISDQEVDILYQNKYFGYDPTENLQRINMEQYYTKYDLVIKEEFLFWNMERSTKMYNEKCLKGHN